MTTTNDKPIPVEVPARYIKDKAVDYDGEAFAAMGGCLTLGNGFRVKPPSFGVYAMLETFESTFIANPAECSSMEFWRALYVNDKRKDCLQDVMEWAYPDRGASFDIKNTDTWKTLDWSVYEWARDLDFCVDADIAGDALVSTHKWFALSFEGFSMIPSSGGGNSPFIFGAETMGSLAAGSGYSMEDILWNIPLCALGHVIAAFCKQNGNSHVKRPKDDEDRKLQFKLARERIRNGELHPWQIADPENWPLMSIQKECDPSIVKRWEKVVEERKHVQ